VNDLTFRLDKLDIIGRTMARGDLIALIHHAHDLMQKLSIPFWSVNPTCQRRNLRDHVSLKFGLCPGWFYGFINRPNNIFATECDSVIWDLGVSARVFARYGSCIRYMNVLALHPFRAPGGQHDIKGWKKRRAAENRGVNKLEKKYPHLVTFAPSLVSSYKQPYRSHSIGPPPLHFRKARAKVGRKRKLCSRRAATITEKTRASRGHDPAKKQKRGRPVENESGKRLSWKEYKQRERATKQKIIAHLCAFPYLCM
jgi:hypothetical protein